MKLKVLLKRLEIEAVIVTAIGFCTAIGGLGKGAYDSVKYGRQRVEIRKENRKIHDIDIDELSVLRDKEIEASLDAFTILCIGGSMMVFGIPCMYILDKLTDKF